MALSFQHRLDLLERASFAFEGGDIQEAKRISDHLFKNSPEWVETHRLGGVIAGALGDHAAAEAYFRQALLLKDGDFNLLLMLAMSLRSQGRFRESLMPYRRAIALEPCTLDGWLGFGLSCLSLGLHQDALIASKNALSISPNSVSALMLEANRLHCTGDVSAIDFYDKVLLVEPRMCEAWSNRAAALNLVMRYEEALNSASMAIQLNPQYVNAWNNKSSSLKELGRYNEALDSARTAVGLSPTNVKALNNLAAVLVELERYSEALEAAKSAVELDPRFPLAWLNLGMAFTGLQSSSEALKCFQHSIALDPEFAEGRLCLAFHQLRRKEFDYGFSNYRWRSKIGASSTSNTQLTPASVRLNGSDSIFLLAEQGLGDEVFFSGFLGKTLELCSTITLAADCRLHPILKRSFPSIAVVDRLATINPSDYGANLAMPFGDLAFLLGLSHDEIRDSRSPYFSADECRTRKVRGHSIFGGGKVVCGISWRGGNPKLRNSRSLNLKDLAPILSIQDIEFVSLQYGNVQAEVREASKFFGRNIYQLDDFDLFNDIDGLLSLISACDFVITTGGVVAVLAGSIGKIGAVLVPKSRAKAWFWHPDDSTSLWYPTLNLFHKADNLTWYPTVQLVSDWAKSLPRGLKTKHAHDL